LGRLVRKVLPARLSGALTSIMAGGSQRAFRWNASVLYGTAGASLFSFAFLVVRGYFLARAVGINLSIPFLAASMAITTLLQLIPVSNVLGIGTREVSLFYLFGLVGIPPEVTIGFSFLIIIALLVQDSFGLVLWWRYPVGTPALGKQL
jgi:uncharacterized membrane protein YbhN (UPF0104 family)